jgi:hypothetical protein
VRWAGGAVRPAVAAPKRNLPNTWANSPIE